MRPADLPPARSSEKRRKAAPPKPLPSGRRTWSRGNTQIAFSRKRTRWPHTASMRCLRAFLHWKGDMLKRQQRGSPRRGKGGGLPRFSEESKSRSLRRIPGIGGYQGTGKRCADVFHVLRTQAGMQRQGHQLRVKLFRDRQPQGPGPEKAQQMVGFVMHARGDALSGERGFDRIPCGRPECAPAGYGAR